ncbi:helix-turn-helix domain-containing protein [Streptomyces brevispora]|uniref:helix-turn-helix domain-containing protein n=1 Tax=Streptomyces brevispora TaxID=887462 RepID=UPI00371E6B31
MKLLREAAGLTQTELGAVVGYGEAQIAAVEQGRRIPKPEMVDAADLAVGGRGVRLRHRPRSDTTSDRPRKRQDPARSIRSDGIL